MIVVGNCLQVLASMASESVHCCITSPPYWGLRSYQGDPGMIGLEPTLEEHIERRGRLRGRGVLDSIGNDS